MEKTPLTDLYENYKKARFIQKKVEGYKHDFDMTVQGVKSTYTFTEHGDAASLHLMIESMNHFLGKNPIGKVMIKYYEIHFKLLEAVVVAVNANDNQLTRAISRVEEELTKFVLNAPTIIQATRFNSSELQQGQFSYMVSIAAKENALNDPQATQTIIGFVKLVAGRAQSMIYWLDELLDKYKALAQNYELLYRHGKRMYAHNEAKGGLTATLTLANGVADLMEFFYNSTYSEVNGHLNRLLKNRNDWANWMNIPTRK